MSLWDTYSSRINARGGDRRGAALLREARSLNMKAPTSLSFHQVTINGEQRSLSVINSDNLAQKTLCTLPGESLPPGGIVEWMGNHWIITEFDANSELYSKAIMRQCNYLLKWIADDGNIIERWCIVEDGTKYLTGEYGDRDFIITRGDARVSLTLPKDKYTIRLNRDARFLIDDYRSPNVLAYRLTKPFKLGGSYGDGGVLYFVLQECNTEDTDNLELHIANYYDHFPRGQEPPQIQDVGEATPPSEDESGKKVWL